MEKKLLLNATLDEFVEAMAIAIGKATLEDSKTLDANNNVKKHYVYGLTGLAQLLGCCRATAASIKASGVIDSAISQTGKIIVIDADLALALLHAKNCSRTSRVRRRMRA